MSDTTFGQYRVLRKLGSGGMGDVYLAEDSRLGRQVALKMLPRYDQSDPAVVARFEREAKSAASLSHPNIVTIYELGEFDGRHFIAMEYVEGGTLAERVSQGPLSEEETLGLGLQIAEGLSAAHSSKVVHRDIKPANILIDRTGRARICDFGLARLGGGATLTRTGTAMGTAAYMSPEQFQGVVVDHRADIWSLGAVLYEMITGQRPFPGDHDSAILYAVAHEECLPPSRRRSGLSVRWDSLITRCLSKDPSARFQLMDELVAALREIKDERQIASFDSGRVKQTAIPSLAVLPFANMSTDAENEFFADGLTEDLITAFSKIPDLRIVARTSAFSFKGQNLDVRMVGQKLGVTFVLEGTVRHAGNRLRVTVQLIDVADGFHLWSEKYDRALADVFAIQDEITERIVAALRVRLVGSSAVTGARGRPSDIAAYKLYLEGRYHWNKRNEAALRTALVCFEKALAIDPHFVLAHVGVSDTHHILFCRGFVAMEVSFPQARTAVEQALQLDPNCAEAHVALASLLFHSQDWFGATAEFERAAQLNQGYATAHHWYGILLLNMGRLEDGQREIERAQDLDPLSLMINTNVAMVHLYRRDYPTAITQARKTLELDPEFASAREILCRACLNSSRYEELVAELPLYLRGYSGVALRHEDFDVALAASGREGLLRKLLDVMTPLSTHQNKLSLPIAALHAQLGNSEEALRWLQRAADAGDNLWDALRYDAAFDTIRGDPRVLALFEGTGLKP